LIFSQFSWEELEPNNSQPIQVIYVTESEEIMGILNHPPQLLSSNDRGESWQVIGFGDNLIDLISEFGAVFKEHQGEFYISSDEAILKLNRTTGSAENWLALDNIWRLDDFAFLPNGNLVVSDSNDILLFDNQKQLIRSKEWSSHSVKFLIGDGDEHYAVHSIGATDYIGKFNSAITELTDYRDYLAPRNQEIIYENGKLFSSESYSEDGELWIPYPDELSGITTYLSSGNLHLIDRDVVYLSLDEGVTFIYQGTLMGY